MRFTTRITCCLLTLSLSTSTLINGQEQTQKYRSDYEAAVKAAEERLKTSISEAQANYLAELERARKKLESHLKLSKLAKTKPENEFEKFVSVVGAEPGPVLQGKDNLGWFEIPNEMKRAVIFTPKKDQRKDGVVEFVVNANTKIGLAASWAYDGNPGGGWHAERKSREDLKKLGWVEKGEMFLNQFDRHTLFVRECEKGEQIRIRTRKYNPPYVFVPNALEKEPTEPMKPATKRDVVIDVAGAAKMDTEEMLGLENTPEILRGTESFTSPLSGVALIKGHRMAKVFVAASWAHDGNSSGQWTEEVWSEETFKEKGWEPVGMVKIKHRGSMQEHKLFVKVFNEGHQARIRTRKYGAPFVFAQKP